MGASAKNDRYDPATDSWASMTDMPAGATNHTGASVGGKVYYGGGDALGLTTNDWREYDPASDTYTTKANLPGAAKHRFGAARVGDLIHIFGGDTASLNDITQHRAYDPVSDSWTTLASLPAGRRWPRGTAVDGNLYVACGYSAGSPVGGMWVYDSTSDSWTVVTGPPLTGRIAFTRTGNGKLYAAMGANVPGATNVHEYDPATDIWTALAAIPVGRLRDDVGSALLDGHLHIVGGDDGITIKDWHDAYHATDQPDEPILQAGWGIPL